MNTKTPYFITPEIKELCKKIVPNRLPFYIDITPDAEAEINECFPNVKRKIEAFGGDIIYGWQIWEWPKIMIEAEFHAVYKDQTGKIMDFTPKQSLDSRILFLPDPDKIYEGKQINNVRQALSKSPLVKEFIEISDKIFEATNEGELAHSHGAVKIPAKKIVPLLGRKEELQKIIENIKTLKIGRNELCPCGSGFKFKKCCGN